MVDRVDATITYNPDPNALPSILSQLRDLNGLPVVIDNSDDSDIQKRVNKACSEFGITLLTQRGNEGTGTALNRALHFALKSDATALHYLDQDTRLLPGYRATLDEYVERHPSEDFIGAERGSAEQYGQGPLRRANFVIASGTWFKVDSLSKMGGFDESLFLDLVDHEACLRLRSQGGLIAVDARRPIAHPIGDGGSSVLGILVTRHPRWRRALMWKNSVVIFRRYFSTFPKELIRHLSVRLFETTVSTYYLKDFSYTTAAFSGLWAGMVCDGHRIGLDIND